MTIEELVERITGSIEQLTAKSQFDAGIVRGMQLILEEITNDSRQVDPAEEAGAADQPGEGTSPTEVASE